MIRTTTAHRSRAHEFALHTTTHPYTLTPVCSSPLIRQPYQRRAMEDAEPPKPRQFIITVFTTAMEALKTATMKFHTQLGEPLTVYRSMSPDMRDYSPDKSMKYCRLSMVFTIGDPKVRAFPMFITTLGVPGDRGDEVVLEIPSLVLFRLLFLPLREFCRILRFTPHVYNNVMIQVCEPGKEPYQFGLDSLLSEAVVGHMLDAPPGLGGTKPQTRRSRGRASGRGGRGQGARAPTRTVQSRRNPSTKARNAAR